MADSVIQDGRVQPLDIRDRHRALGLTLAAAAAVLVLAARIHHNKGPLWLDRQGQRVADGHLFGIPLVPDHAARLVVSLGDVPVFAILMAAVVVVALTLRDRMAAAVALAAGPLALLATEVIGKPMVGRVEGPGLDLGFPSGHTTAISTLMALLVLLAYRRWKGLGLTAIAPAVALVLAMELALVRIDLHLFSDTIAGALIGGGSVVGLAWLASVLVALRSARGSAASPQRC